MALVPVAAPSEIVAVWEVPLSVAVRVAVGSAATAPAVAVNVPVVPPDPTVTEAGTANAAALLDRLTVAPPVFDTVTVHVELPPDPRLSRFDVGPIPAGAVSSLLFAIARPQCREALRLAHRRPVTVPAVAAN